MWPELLHNHCHYTQMLCFLWNTQMPCFLCRTDFIATASQDGHLKFWKKQEDGIEFVKHFRAHLGQLIKILEITFPRVSWFSLCLGKIVDVAVSADGMLLCTTANDKSLKVFDVINFGELSFVCYIVCSKNVQAHTWSAVSLVLADMINMFRLKFVPSCCVWLYAGGAATPAVAW